MNRSRRGLRSLAPTVALALSAFAAALVSVAPAAAHGKRGRGDNSASARTLRV
jgi:hypothetical protein